MRRIPAILALLVASLVLPAAPARAAEYELSTAATYAVLPDAGRVEVTIAATFVNTTPNPTGRFSVFDEIKLAVQDGATELAARDGEGELEATLVREDDVNVATITLREGVRFEERLNLTITYRLPDAGASGLRVRPSAVVFPAWAFGTKGTVTVTVPSGFEVSTDGDPLSASPGTDGITLTSGDVADPTRWLSLVIASGEAAYQTTTRSVPLDGGTVDLQVRYFEDDAVWGGITADLLADLLPALQQTLGLEYTRQGPVVVTEVVDIGPGGGIGEGGSTSPELMIGFDQAPFTVVHQAAHLWITDQLASDRWIREGLASWAAGEVAASRELAPPYDPEARTAELADAAFPLESWGVGSATDEQDAFGYAASWSLTNELAAAVGPEAMATALRRVVAGRSAYDRLAAEEPAAGAVPVRPVDSRRFLDHLEAVSDADLVQHFAERVFAAGIADELTARAAARTAYDELLVAAGDWGAPATVTEPMAAWSFPVAMAAIADAKAWLVKRDALVTRIAEAGLTTPARLHDRYAQFGGGSEADAELAAEGAVVDAYQAALDASVVERGLVERIGLLAGPDPATILEHANGAFAEGDLETALAEAQRAQALLDGSETAGIVRLMSAGVVLLVGLAAAIWLLRRRRTLPSRHDA